MARALERYATLVPSRPFGLEREQLFSLGEIDVEIHAPLDVWTFSPALLNLDPDERREFLWRRARRSLGRLRRWYELDGLSLAAGSILPGRGSRPVPALVGHVKAKKLESLLRFRELSHVRIVQIDGIAPSSEAPPTLQPSWYCVHGRYVLQYEGQTAGMQLVEQRYTLWKAASFDQAARRAVAESKSYGVPRLTGDLHLSRWHLEEIIDVYRCDDPADGSEVFSSTAPRRCRPDSVWVPKHVKRVSRSIRSG